MKYLNKGVLSKAKQQKTEKSPSYTGKADIQCVHCSGHNPLWLSGWVNDGEYGKYFSLSFKQREEGDQGPKKGGEKMDDDIPF